MLSAKPAPWIRSAAGDHPEEATVAPIGEALDELECGVLFDEREKQFRRCRLTVLEEPHLAPRLQVTMRVPVEGAMEVPCRVGVAEGNRVEGSLGERLGVEMRVSTGSRGWVGGDPR